jgi:hypothetical protein
MADEGVLQLPGEARASEVKVPTMADRRWAFAAERASVFEDDRAVDYVVRIEPDTGMTLL